MSAEPENIIWHWVSAAQMQFEPISWPKVPPEAKLKWLVTVKRSQRMAAMTRAPGGRTAEWKSFTANLGAYPVMR